jgi:DNA helicase-4
LLTVGDDWQAINRFAGADISVMREFEKWFGRGEELALTKTFRCPQSICDVSKRFVRKNPFQISKRMKSSKDGMGLPVEVLMETDAPDVASVLLRLSESISNGEIPRAAAGKTRVDVLARYNFQLKDRPRSVPANLDVNFRTVHGSKGLEADYVVPESDPFPNAEERRLLFVALTRARHQVILLASSRNPSSFVMELSQNPSVQVISIDGSKVQFCPKCKMGTLVERKGHKGLFLGCSSFPACTHTQ